MFKKSQNFCIRDVIFRLQEKNEINEIDSQMYPSFIPLGNYCSIRYHSKVPCRLEIPVEFSPSPINV